MANGCTGVTGATVLVLFSTLHQTKIESKYGLKDPWTWTGMGKGEDV
jgi:hypothetical protein